MPRLFKRLLYTLAAATDNELRKQIQFLKAENEILRSRLQKRVVLTTAERARLVKFGRPLGKAIRNLITIVRPETFREWCRTGVNPKKRTPTRKPGRPRTPDDIRDLVIRIASETGWGYTRILGELKKLGIHTVSRSTVVNILREHGFEPGPTRGEATWDTFVKTHAATLWACDFMSVRSWTKRGLVDLYMLIFVHVASRRVIVSQSTANPDREWVTQQARNFCIEEGGTDGLHLIRDRDKKFMRGFDQLMESSGVTLHQLPIRAPNLNAMTERFIQTMRHECLDHFVVLGKRHLDHLVSEFVEHYHEERPHQGLGNRVIKPPNRMRLRGPGSVRCRERLGGVLKHYSCAA